MRRLVVAGLLSIAALAAGSVLLLDRLYRDGPPPRAPARVQEPAPAPSGPGAEGFLLPPPAVPEGFQEAAKVAGLGGSDAAAYDKLAPRQAPRPAPAPESWEAVPLQSGRTRGRDPVVAAINRELNDLHDDLVTCFQADVAARMGGAVPTRTKEEVQDEAGSTVFVLQLELRQGQVRIEDAPVALAGGASDGTLACAQGKLRGKVFAAPGARAGERRRMQFDLNP